VNHQRVPLCLVFAAFLGSFARAQFQIDWTATYGNSSPSGFHQEQVTSCAVASNGDVFHNVLSFPPFGGMWPEFRVACYSSAGTLLSNTKLNSASNQGWPLASTGGNAGAASDCSGAVSLDMNAFASGALGGNPAAQLTLPGTRVWMQAWSRDSGSPSGTNLASALTFVVLP
jgi:hypothetical protein